MPERVQHYLVISAGVVIALLIAANILLLKTVQEIQKPGVARVTAENTAEVPELPPTSKGVSSKALIREIDRTKREFRDPLDQTLGQLQSLNGNTATLGGFPTVVEQMAASAQSLGDSAASIPGLGKQLRGMNRQIRKLVDYMLGLGAVATSLEKTLQSIQTDIAKIRQCEEKSPNCG